MSFIPLHSPSPHLRAELESQLFVLRVFKCDFHCYFQLPNFQGRTHCFVSKQCMPHIFLPKSIYTTNVPPDFRGVLQNSQQTGMRCRWYTLIASDVAEYMYKKQTNPQPSGGLSIKQIYKQIPFQLLCLWRGLTENV